MPVVRREPERQQLLLRHGAARVVPEAVEELGLPHSKIRVLPPPLGRPRERRGVVAEVASEAAAAAATSSALRPPLVLRRLRPTLLLRVDDLLFLRLRAFIRGIYLVMKWLYSLIDHTQLGLTRGS